MIRLMVWLVKLRWYRLARKVVALNEWEGIGVRDGQSGYGPIKLPFIIYDPVNHSMMCSDKKKSWSI